MLAPICVVARRPQDAQLLLFDPTVGAKLRVLALHITLLDVISLALGCFGLGPLGLLLAHVVVPLKGARFNANGRATPFHSHFSGL